MTLEQLYTLQQALDLLKAVDALDLISEAQEIYQDDGNTKSYVTCFESHETIANFDALLRELTKGGAE